MPALFYKHRIRALCLGHMTATKETSPKKREDNWRPRQTEPFNLLSQPFCWLTFSHWTIDSVNCRRASHTMRNKELLRYLPHRNLDVCNRSRLSHELTGFFMHRSHRMKELTEKSRGGGVCFYINNSWCDERNLHSIKSFCYPDLEFHMLLCRPFWLPREFSAIIITAVYIPPQANTDQALNQLYGNISEQELCTQIRRLLLRGTLTKPTSEQ